MKARKIISDRAFIISASLGKGCYRHIKIPSDKTLFELGDSILDAFDFNNDHLHAFFIDNESRDTYYLEPDLEERDSTEYTLEQAGFNKGLTFTFLFDFGDEWEFKCKVLRIEALTMLDMVRRDILPAVSAFAGSLAKAANEKRALCPDMDVSYETETTRRLSALTASAAVHSQALEKAMDGVTQLSDTYAAARYYRDRVFPAMQSLRTVVDEMETLCDAKAWPIPSYGEILFSVK